MSKLPWRSAWITGASSGIGEAVSLRLLSAGVDVYATARDLDRLNEVKNRSINQGDTGVFMPLPCDLTEPESVKELLSTFPKDNFPDLILLNAGNYYPDHLENIELSKAQQLFAINFFAVINTLSQIAPLCRKGNSQVGVVASLAGYTGLPGATVYCASKAALINACESLYPEFTRRGVKLQLINPGFVRTPLTAGNPFPMPWLIEPDEAAEQIIKGLQSNRFEIRFPTLFAASMSLLRHLPYMLRNRITSAALPKTVDKL